MNKTHNRSNPKSWFSLLIYTLPTSIKWSIYLSIAFTVVQYIIDLIIAYLISDFNNNYLHITALLVLISLITRPLVLILQHWSMRKGTLLGVEYVLKYLFNSNVLGNKGFTSELLLKSNNIPIYIVQPIIHFFASIFNLTLSGLVLFVILEKSSIDSLYLLLLLFTFLLLGIVLRRLNKKYAQEIKYHQEKLGVLAPNFVEGRKELYKSKASSILLEQYLDFENLYRKAVNGQRFLSQYPKQAIESLALAILVLLYFFEFPLTRLSSLGAVGYIAMRSLPQLGNLIASYSSLIGYFPSTASVFEGLTNVGNDTSKQKDTNQIQLRISNLSINHCKVENFNMQLCAGDKYILDMPSGYGKSSILDYIAGFRSDNSSYSGKIHLLNRPYYLQQNTFLYEGELGVNIFMSIDWKKNITEPSRRYVENLLTTLGLGLSLEDEVSRSTLSGGEIQRISVVRFLMSDYRLGLLDEAMSALDEDTAKRAIKLLVDCDKSIIMTIHNNELKSFAENLGFKIIK